MHFQHDVGLKEFFKSRIDLPNPDDDVFISSTRWAFRNRLRRTQQDQLRFPFMCFRTRPGGIQKPETDWIRNWRATHGAFLEEVGDRVKIIPFQADYDAIFWSHKYFNSAKVFEDFFTENFDDFRFTYEYVINDVTYEFEGSFEFLNFELDPEFNEEEELSKHKLHSVDLSFQIKAFLFKGQGVQLADGAVVEYFYNGEITDDPDRTTIVTGQDFVTGTGTG